MTDDAQPTEGSPYAPAATAARPSDEVAVALRRNPLGTAALIGAGVLVVVQAIFQAVVLGAANSADLATMSTIQRLVQPLAMAFLAVVTTLLGAIAVLLPERRRLAAGIGLGAGAYALASIVMGIVMGIGYAFF